MSVVAWFGVDERLPEIWTQVLVFVPGADVVEAHSSECSERGTVLLAYRNEGDQWASCDEVDIPPPSHWARYPKPPEVDE